MGSLPVDRLDLSSLMSTHSAQLASSGVPEHLWAAALTKLSAELFDAGSAFTLAQDEDGALSVQLASSGVPEHLWAAALTKLSAELFDAGSAFTLAQDEDGTLSVQATRDTSATAEPEAVFLVDHAWTFEPKDARKQLRGVAGLAERMAGLLGLEEEGDARVDAVLRDVWLKAQTYSVRRPGLSAEELQPLWYVMDEFGSAVGHGDEPNVRLVPFFFAPANASFSLLFPVGDIGEGDEVLRDYAEAAQRRNPAWRQLYLLPWLPVDLSSEASDNVAVPDSVFTADRELEALPEEESDSSPEKRPRLEAKRPLRVWAESEQIVKHLSAEHFARVDTMEEADVLWWSSHFKDYKGLRSEWPGKVVNQFACESVVTVKDLLAATLQKAYPPNGPAWLPRTFNLHRELPQFVAEYQKREEAGQDNSWIVKPWNLARALDTHVSDSLAQIVRLVDSGPKVAQKYLHDSLLFQRPDSGAWVKMDLRFIVLLRQAKPLSLHLFKGFWLRFGLKEWAGAEYDDYERHFTVFNYADESKILQMRCEAFIKALQEQNPGLSWSSVESRIHSMLVELFTAATAEAPPKGILPNAQSAAMYGVDLMLVKGPDGEVWPRLLEVNFMPDCERACDYYPDFADAVFHTLFSPSPTDHPQGDLVLQLA